MANKLRGEAKVTIGDVEIVLAAEMASLARLSAAVGHPMLQELYARLMGTEIYTSIAAVRLLAVSGRRNGETLDRVKAGEAAAEQIAFSDLPALQQAFETILGGLMRPAKEGEQPKPGDDPKNG